MRGFLIVPLCLAIWAVTPALRSYAETQAAMTADACLALENSNAEMKRIHRQIVRDHNDNKRFITAFNKTQRAWSAFRDADLNAIYPEPSEFYGSVYGMCRCTVLNELTRERIETLKKWLLKGTEGDVCAGSMKWERR
jgi:uncharacterized protein YecT (DUF1311 family)